MASILDIVSATETVKVGDVGVTLKGVGIDAIARVLSACPELADLMKPGGLARVDPAMLLLSAPFAVHTVIAEAAGTPDEATIRAVGVLPFGVQIDLLEAIIRLTFPGGILPFVPRLVRLLGDPPAATVRQPNGAGGAIVEPVMSGAPPSTN